MTEVPRRDERLRIGVIAPPWLTVPPRRYGGVEAAVDTLVRGLAAAGHTVLLWASTDSTNPWLASGPGPSTGVATMGDATLERRSTAAAYEWLRGRVDVIHDHTAAGPDVVALSDVPVVVTMHGPGERDVVPWIGSDRPDALVAISRRQASFAEGREVDAVIHHGIDVRGVPIGDGAGDPIGVGADARRGEYLAFLGRMAPEKGVDVAIEVARSSGHRLLLAAKCASPEERSYFDDVVAPQLDDDVRFVGELGAAAKYRLLGGARALLNPLRWNEPFGLVMIEALACGTPVITTHWGAAPEIVRDGFTGWVCADDPASLVDAVGRVDEIDRTHCRLEAEVRFPIERLAADHEALYRRVLNQRTSGHEAIGREAHGGLARSAS